VIERPKLIKRFRLWPLAIALQVLISFTSAAQRREHVVENWKPIRYDVNLAFDDRLNEIQRAQTRIDGQILKDSVRSIDLDFGSLAIDAVTIESQPARYERTPETINVFLGQTVHAGDKFSIVIAYHGRPKDGLVFAADRDGKPSVTGDNWPNRVHQWIPCLDHPSAKATVSFTIAAPARELVVANGKFDSVKEEAGAQRVWHFTESVPIPAYCMVIAVNEGAKLDATESAPTALSYYIPLKDRAYAPKGFAPGAPALTFFSQTIAPYPYEKLALIVGATRFGGMENSSAIVFASGLFDLRSDEKMSAHFGIPNRIESVVAHEIAHQWFGDSVTESTWADLWLSEGFATYFAGLFIEKYDGEAAFHDYLRTAAARYFAYEKSRNAPIRDTETEDLMKLLNENNYQKGAWVLHMLRMRLGDEKFFHGLRGYYNAHAQGNATSEDLRDALEKASGQDLHQFFARWVFNSGHPRYQVSWGWNSAKDSLDVTIDQLQDGEPFLDPLPIKMIVSNQEMRKIVDPTGKHSTFSLRLAGTPTSVELDPDETLLREIMTKP
jgi:aminopeptidase N